MRHAVIIGSSTAAAFVSLVGTSDSFGYRASNSYPYLGRVKAPNDIGPVVDSTRESKRAKRRRIALEKR